MAAYITSKYESHYKHRLNACDVEVCIELSTCANTVTMHSCCLLNVHNVLTNGNHVGANITNHKSVT